MAYVRVLQWQGVWVWEWQVLCKSWGGRAYVRVRDWQGLCTSVGVAHLT